mgnify:CR=1 FL=1
MYNNYDGGLDLHVDVGEETICYILEMPPISRIADRVFFAYPLPPHWWIAIGKNYSYRQPIRDQDGSMEFEEIVDYDDLLDVAAAGDAVSIDPGAASLSTEATAAIATDLSL